MEDKETIKEFTDEELKDERKIIINEISRRKFNADLKLTMDELDKYKRAYEILMQYWDSLPDEEKPKIDEEFRGIGI